MIAFESAAVAAFGLVLIFPVWYIALGLVMFFEARSRGRLSLSPVVNRRWRVNGFAVVIGSCLAFVAVASAIMIAGADNGDTDSSFGAAMIAGAGFLTSTQGLLMRTTKPDASRIRRVVGSDQAHLGSFVIGLGVVALVVAILVGIGIA